jgi:hypothetical protein
MIPSTLVTVTQFAFIVEVTTFLEAGVVDMESDKMLKHQNTDSVLLKTSSDQS